MIKELVEKSKTQKVTMHYHIQMRKKVLKHTQEAEWKQSGNKMYATNIENKEDSHQKKKKIKSQIVIYL